MKKIRCLVADDELLSQEILEAYIEKLEKLELAGKCKNGVEVFNMLKTTHIDLLFLDIQMPQLTGIELLKTIKHPPKVIFTTAFRDFAVEGYELNALDYLLKPISFERFLKAIDKYEDTMNPVHGAHLYTASKDAGNNFIYVKADKKNLKLFLKDILYIEGMKDHVKIRTVQKDILSYQTLADLEKQLPTDMFLRIHRSFIVSLNKIISFTASSIEIAGNELPIGSFYLKEVRKVLSI